MDCGAAAITYDIKIDSSKEGNNESYQKIKLIGKGNLGKVFLAKSTSSKKRVCSKRMKC